MKTIIVLLIYIVLLIALSNSKLKNTWIIWIAFIVGYCAEYIADFIIKHLY